MEGCAGCGQHGEFELPPSGEFQSPGSNSNEVLDLNYDRAIINVKMSKDMIAWILFFNIEPCDCEKDKDLKKLLEETRKIIDNVLERL